MLSFKDLRISSSLLQALELKGNKCITPIQQETIPLILSKNDILGYVRTDQNNEFLYKIFLWR
jgi:superfamily II DNA/RNA helicase